MSEENLNISEDNASEENVDTPVEANEMPMADSALFGDGGNDEKPPKADAKPPRRVTLTTFVCSCIALVLAAVMLTYTLCNSAYQSRLAEIRAENVSSGGAMSELDVLAQIFEAYSFEDLDEEEIRVQLLKAYVRATGDKYAEYYTNEEYAALSAERAGESQGIGINIINSSVEINGYEYKALKVINVMKDSPAETAGINFGDYIIAVGTEDDYVLINDKDVGYDRGLAMLQGEKGTVARFGIYRADSGATEFMAITRDEFITSSVMSVKADAEVGENIGVVRISSFDLTTPTQLVECVEELKADGCNKFVFDVRYNPGGDLTSIVAVLSLFLEEGDTVISVKDKNGEGEVTTVAPVEYDKGNGCSVKAEDIGRYKDLDMIVLCNESTASAAELFVANFRDHGLGEIVGTKTYGKGSMQTFFNLAFFGINGYLKMTSRMYYPPNGESYDGVGIEPTYTVELPEDAATRNIYDIMGTTADNQLVAATNKYFK